jgi:hypothetical protein
MDSSGFYNKKIYYDDSGDVKKVDSKIIFSDPIYLIDRYECYSTELIRIHPVRGKDTIYIVYKVEVRGNVIYSELNGIIYYIKELLGFTPGSNKNIVNNHIPFIINELIKKNKMKLNKNPDEKTIKELNGCGFEVVT